MKQFVLIGYPLGHSLSPVMHNAALKTMGLENEFRYDIQPTLENELQAFVASIREGTVEGANITIPYKTNIMDHLEVISDEANALGSVNTLYRVNDAVAGCNTDVSGFLESLREHAISLKGLHATILGAGGAARAVAFTLIKEGITQLDILNRTLSKAEDLVRKLIPKGQCDVRAGTLKATREDLSETNLLINCTPIGMNGHSVTESPLRNKIMHRGMVVMDLVYNPRRTKLLQEAEQVGAKTIDGTGMLIHQGAAALEIWVGEKPPIEVMRSAVVRALGG
ncbi:MAG: shikimate dehydrogenase [Candidatus Thorarchaeota archaeon]|nr:MAG: shikimate dehydrogenase [Candidatus Thorarchaeota archaeon]